MIPPAQAADASTVSSCDSPVCDNDGSVRSFRSTSSHKSASVERWQSAITRVSLARSFLGSFNTLRDMSGECYVDPKRLKLLKELGSGAYASVHLAELSPASGEGPKIKVAAKCIHPHLLREQHELESFAGEAKLLRKLKHPNIVDFIGVGGHSVRCRTPPRRNSIRLLPSNEDQQDPKAAPSVEHTIILQEFMDGGTLKNRVLAQMTAASVKRKRLPYTDTEALGWMIQVAEGLHYLHTAHPCVIHRDLKLENIVCKKMPDGAPRFCLCDFGLSALVRINDSAARRQMEDSARQCEDSDNDEKANVMQLLSTEMDERLLQCAMEGERGKSLSGYPLASPTFDLTGKTGSFFYMAPETVRCQPSNEKVDVFAFGVILYEVFSYTMTSAIVSGPTLHPMAAEVYALKVARGYRRPLYQHWPESLKELIEDCWAEAPSLRPSMTTILQRLKEMQADNVFETSSQLAASKQGCGCNIM